MRFVNIYLIGYFLLVLGALAALWYGGALRHISAIWIIIGLVIAASLGIMLAISAGRAGNHPRVVISPFVFDDAVVAFE